MIKLLALTATLSFSQDVMRLSEIPTLYGGRAVLPGELPVSVWIGNCTGTIVGEETLITAAHCRPRQGSSVSFRVGAVSYQGSCSPHPDYNRGGYTNNDFALCKFAPKITMEHYGSIWTEPVKVGDKVIMQGYGAPQITKHHVAYSEIYRINSQDLMTRGSVFLGGGDSGGGLFLAEGTDLRKGPFKWVGVNSRRQTNCGNNCVSYFNAAMLERSKSFFRSWAERNRTEVCGVNKECLEPPVRDPVPGCEPEWDILSWAKSELSKAEGFYNSCKAVVK